MLDQRRRRWADVVQMLLKYFLFAGMNANIQLKNINSNMITAEN